MANGQSSTPVSGAGFSPRIAALLSARLQGRVKVAVFDFDNTCIKNDLGDAVLLRLVLDLAYHGELDAFWALIPDPTAARELRSFWTAHHDDPRLRGHRPGDWPAWSAAYRDYVVLFLQQYQKLLADPAVAYPWALQLQVGMTVPAVGELARQVFADELRQPIGLEAIRSERFGAVEVTTGIRVYAAVQRLIADLQNELGWQAWIVTATGEAAVKSVAPRLGVPGARVIGMRLEEDADGRFTARVRQPITYRNGKMAALRARGLEPELVAGDSTTDLEMLQAAQNALVIDRGALDAASLASLDGRLIRQDAALLSFLEEP